MVFAPWLPTDYLSFHVLSSHSPRVAAIGNQLDYLGVIVLMWGATIPTVFYGFHDEIRLQIFYCSMVGITRQMQIIATDILKVSVLGLLCVKATLKRFRTPVFRPYRAAMYASLGFSALVSITHGVIINGREEQRRRMGLDWMLLMAICNLSGAPIYAVRVSGANP